jgi:hypothetical protein
MTRLLADGCLLCSTPSRLKMEAGSQLLRAKTTHCTSLQASLAAGLSGYSCTAANQVTLVFCISDALLEANWPIYADGMLYYMGRQQLHCSGTTVKPHGLVLISQIWWWGPLLQVVVHVANDVASDSSRSACY